MSTAAEGDEAERKGVPPCPPPVCVVCLGLGSLADSTKAQDQYILLKEVLEELEGVVRPLYLYPSSSQELTHDLQLDKNVKTEFYDPVFTPEDAAFLASEGHSVLSAEVLSLGPSLTPTPSLTLPSPSFLQHPLHLPRPTLLYIPHGPRTLFDALLAANWTSAEQLGRVVVLGNRLDLYDDPTYSGSMRRSDGDGSGRRKGKGVKSEGGGDELGESAEYVVQAGSPSSSFSLSLCTTRACSFQFLPHSKTLQHRPPSRYKRAPRGV